MNHVHDLTAIGLSVVVDGYCVRRYVTLWLIACARGNDDLIADRQICPLLFRTFVHIKP